MCNCNQGRNPPCVCADEKDPGWLIALSFLAAFATVIATILFIGTMVHHVWGLT